MTVFKHPITKGRVLVRGVEFNGGVSADVNVSAATREYFKKAGIVEAPKVQPVKPAEDKPADPKK